MSGNRGEELERRAHRLAWHLGYFARRKVFIYTSERDHITDIDVIGIKFDDTLSPHIILFETKHERGFSSILKLRGLLDYYTAESAYIIRPNITPAIIQFAEELQIKGIHTSRLEEMEKGLNIDPNDWSLSFSTDFDKRFLPMLGVLRRNGFKSEVLLRDLFWVGNNPFYKIKKLKETILSLSKRREKTKKPSLKSALALLIIELTILFSVCVLQSAGILHTLPEHQRHSIFAKKLISGKLSLKEKEELINKTYDFLAKYTRDVLHQPLIMRREDFSLTPPYADELYNLLSRILKKPQNAKAIPRLFDIYLSILIQSKKPDLIDLQGFLNLSRDEFEYTLKFSRDTVQFLFENKVPNFFSPLMTE